MNSPQVDHKSADFKKIICRRVPIKLLQFARLLSEVLDTEIDPVRIKAMESQIRKTRETCLEYGVESTASLLGNIESQLKLDVDALQSQVPLIRRFVQRLESHAERLKLGQIDSGTSQQVKAQSAPSNTEQSLGELDASADLEPMPQAEEPETVITDPNDFDFGDSIIESTGNTQAIETTKTEVSGAEVATEESGFHFTATVGEDKKVSSELLNQVSELTVYWCIADDQHHELVKEQLFDFGYNVEDADVSRAIEIASGDSQKVVIARLEDFEYEETINHTSHLILLADHDTIENRLKGIRLGSTLFFTEPVDTVKLMEYLDTLEHSKDDAPFRVAVMEDSKAQAKFNDKVLKGAGFDTCTVIEPMELLNALSSFDPEVIFMDMQMPGCNGIELTKLLRQIERFSTVPIVFLSAEENFDKQREAMTSGGTAFIEKPVKKEQLLFTAELYARRTRNLQPHLARDFQTGLNSSALLREQLTIEAERAMRNNDTMFFALLEIDGFSVLNKEQGYAFGDRTLQQLARLLRQRLRKTDCVGFFEGHRIGVILNHCSEREAESIMSYLTQAYAGTPIAFEGQQIDVSLSVGLSQLGQDYDIQRLVKRAEAALKQAQTTKDSQLIWAYEAKK